MMLFNHNTPTQAHSMYESSSILLQISMSVMLIQIAVQWKQLVLTLLVATTVPALMDTLEMAFIAMVLCV